MIRVPSAQNINEQSYIPALKKAKVLAVTGFANLLELYDFTLFAVLLPVLSRHFFSSNNHESSMLIGYLAFAISFLIAPVGSIIWGYIGDRFGSDKIFKLSLLLMAFPSLAISLLPTYEEAGYIAPILLILLRIFQGFSASGEVLASKIYAFDKVGAPNFLQASALISAFGGIGVLLALYGGAYVSANMDSPIWRIPFALGGGMILVMMFVRIGLLKDDGVKAKSTPISILSVITIVRENKESATYGFAASAMLGVFSYFMHGFLVNFQTYYLGCEIAFAYKTTKIALIGTIVAASLLGLLYRGVVNKKVLCRSILAIAIFIMPLYLLLLLKLKLITYISLFLMGGLLGVFASLSGVYVITAFAIQERCRGALLVNAFGVAIFGGLTPVIMSILAGINILLPGIALSGVFVIGYLILITYNNHPRRLISESHKDAEINSA